MGIFGKKLSLRKWYKKNVGKHSKSVRRKLGLTGKKIKKALGLDHSKSVLSSQYPTSANTYQYDTTRTISSLMR